MKGVLLGIDVHNGNLGGYASQWSKLFNLIYFAK
jgi:hypothetical protein